VYPDDYSLALDETPTRDAFRLELVELLNAESKARVNKRRRSRVA